MCWYMDGKVLLISVSCLSMYLLRFLILFLAFCIAMAIMHVFIFGSFSRLIGCRVVTQKITFLWHCLMALFFLLFSQASRSCVHIYHRWPCVLVSVKFLEPTWPMLC